MTEKNDTRVMPQGDGVEKKAASQSYAGGFLRTGQFSPLEARIRVRGCSGTSYHDHGWCSPGIHNGYTTIWNTSSGVAFESAITPRRLSGSFTKPY